MKIGFDLDGTLDHSAVRDLCNYLYGIGCNIHIITAGPAHLYGTFEETWDAKIEKLKRLGVEYHQLHVIHDAADMVEVGKRKAEIVNEENIKIMIDDSSTFVKEMVKDTTAVILHLKRQESKL